eukprot:403370522
MALYSQKKQNKSNSIPENITDQEIKEQLVQSLQPEDQKKLQVIEKSRQKINKYRAKWEHLENSALQHLNQSTQCNFTCSRECFLSFPNKNVINLFIDCLVPQCNCMNIFSSSKVPDPIYNKSEQNYGLIVLKNLSESVNEGFPLVHANLTQNATGYNLIQECNTDCQSDCLEIKKYVPLETVVQCQRLKCNCWYNLDAPILEQIPIEQLQNYSNASFNSTVIIEQSNLTITQIDSLNGSIKEDFSVIHISGKAGDVFENNSQIIAQDDRNGQESIKKAAIDLDAHEPHFVPRDIKTFNAGLLEAQEQVIISNQTYESNSPSEGTIKEERIQISSGNVEKQPIEVKEEKQNVFSRIYQSIFGSNDEQKDKSAKIVIKSENITQVSTGGQPSSAVIQTEKVIIPQQDAIQINNTAVSFLALDDAMISQESAKRKQHDKDLLNATLCISAVFLIVVMIYGISHQVLENQKNQERQERKASYKSINVHEKQDFFTFNGESNAAYQKLEG